eukprot:508069-Pelagomonas_calceolata.AAC.2
MATSCDLTDLSISNPNLCSQIEWATAMSLLWQYAEVSGNPRWKGLAWGLLPCFGSAMCACTWHFFYNAPEMEYLVALQVRASESSCMQIAICTGYGQL